MTQKLRVCLCAVVAMSMGILSVGCNRSPQAKEAEYLKRGAALLAKKDYGRAALEFRNAVKEMPKDAEPYYQLGLSLPGERQCGERDRRAAPRDGD